ncbi:hypothetical protein H5410_027465 [Solanum commersonii]|uniref:F-box domain-containing protein n=1 Tax=Solanum commersonii TaxID=4109 RepID=A0A9J5Z1C5_SOLCO|nr:hypothetical protein H5410_027465 [Solanum commersonii]
MMVNINNRGTEGIIDENDIDKIYDLPIDILDEIFKNLPFGELVKTRVLSKKWNFFWAMHPLHKHVKELTLNIHKRKRYTLPFCIFDCPTLTYLRCHQFHSQTTFFQSIILKSP